MSNVSDFTVWGKLNLLEVFRNPLHFPHAQERAPFWQLETLWKHIWTKSTYSHTHTRTTMGWESSSESSAVAKIDGFSQNWARRNTATAKNLTQLLQTWQRVLASTPNRKVAPRRALIHPFRIRACKQHLFFKVTFAINFSILLFRRLKSTFLKNLSSPLLN